MIRNVISNTFNRPFFKRKSSDEDSSMKAQYEKKELNFLIATKNDENYLP